MKKEIGEEKTEPEDFYGELEPLLVTENLQCEEGQKLTEAQIFNHYLPEAVQTMETVLLGLAKLEVMNQKMKNLAATHLKKPKTMRQFPFGDEVEVLNMTMFVAEHGSQASAVWSPMVGGTSKAVSSPTSREGSLDPEYKPTKCDGSDSPSYCPTSPSYCPTSPSYCPSSPFFRR